MVLKAQLVHLVEWLRARGTQPLAMVEFVEQDVNVDDIVPFAGNSPKQQLAILQIRHEIGTRLFERYEQGARARQHRAGAEKLRDRLEHQTNLKDYEKDEISAAIGVAQARAARCDFMARQYELEIIAYHSALKR